MRAHRVVIAPYAAAAMYALADDIERYPDFLPWCSGAEVSRNGENVKATLHIRYLGLSTGFTTSNTHAPHSRIDMELADGPLSSLTGGWRFSDLGDGRSRVEFDLHYTFAPGLAGALFARVFDAAFGKFVDCFMERARDCYGSGDSKTIKVQIADTAAANLSEETLELPVGATVADALRAFGRADADAVGIFGRECNPQTPLFAGARVEIYQPLARDPREARRERTKSAKS